MFFFQDLNNYQTTKFHITTDATDATDATPTRLKTELQSGIWTTSRSAQEDKNNSRIIYVLVNDKNN